MARTCNCTRQGNIDEDNHPPPCRICDRAIYETQLPFGFDIAVRNGREGAMGARLGSTEYLHMHAGALTHVRIARLIPAVQLTT